jgi:hypothetical protein
MTDREGDMQAVSLCYYCSIDVHTARMGNVDVEGQADWRKTRAVEKSLFNWQIDAIGAATRKGGAGLSCCLRVLRS